MKWKEEWSADGRGGVTHLLLIGVFLMWPAIVGATESGLWQARLYSENSYETRTRKPITNNDLRVLPPARFEIAVSEKFRLSPFIGARVDLDGASDDPMNLTDQRSSPVLGIESRNWPLGIGAYAQRFVDGAQFTAYHYGRWSESYSPSSAVTFFIETYSDLSHLSEWDGNAVLTHWTKLGANALRWRGLSADVISEFNLSRDLESWAYANFIDFRLGTRVSYRTSSLMSSALVTSDTGAYFGAPEYRSSWKFLFVISIETRFVETI